MTGDHPWSSFTKKCVQMQYYGGTDPFSFSSSWYHRFPYVIGKISLMVYLGRGRGESCPVFFFWEDDVDVLLRGQFVWMC